MSHIFKLSAVSSAILAGLFAMPIYAEEQDEKAENAKAEETENIEVIKVRGLRSSLRKAANAKRYSESVSDSIYAEDVGKSTDQNIADALSRVTGVTVQEEGGEGTRISVRGAGPSLNQISMNGVALTGGLSTDGSNSAATNDNSVDLSSFSSDILSSIDVIKTASADQDEGSLGANVVLRTVKPLGLSEPRRSFTVEGRYNEFSDEADSRLNFSFADKYFDDTFGFVITASRDTQKTRQDRINTDWANGAIPIADLEAGSGRTAHDIQSGMPIRVLGYQRDEEGNLIYGDDGNPLLNPMDSLINYDPDTQKLHEGDLFVLAREVVDFSMNTDERDRFSISTGLQYQPMDNLDIQLDVTHTQQDILTDNHTLRLNFSPVTPLMHPGDDNTALNGVDLSTNTLARSSSRSTSGNFNRAYGLREVDTNVASLNFDYQITDRLNMNLKAGFSQTTDETPDDNEDDRFISISTATWGTAGRQIVENMNHDAFEMVGYDCSSGADCGYSTGMTPAQFDVFDGTSNNVYSRFTPFDMQHNHLGSLVLRKNELEDTNKSLFLDFNYDLDNEYITSIEFGAKWSKRNKDVSIQNRATTNGEDLIDLEDPDAEFEVRGLGTIRLADILSGDAFPYDNYGEDIQGDRGADFFGGWPMMDAEKALEIVSGKDSGQVGIRETISGSREIETETKAAYFKANFELMEGRLTGNLGVRYIRDDTEATGVGGINFIRFPQMLDPYNLLVERGLGNMNLDACPGAVMGTNPDGVPDHRYAPANEADLQNCWAWQLTHGYNRSNDETFPYDPATGQWVIPGADGLVGPDVNRLVWTDADGNIITNNALPGMIYDSNGNLVPTSANAWAHFASNGQIWPFIDRTTAFTGPMGSGTEVQDRIAWVTNKGSHDMWLPSLNLNYAINEEMIGRFAVSRTMTRPRFDSLNPRTQIFEQQWDTASGSAGNAQLKPLQSNNIDLSYEWYFNESGMFSAALFYKDMSDFEETVIVPYHYKDVREEYDLESADLLLPFDENRTPGDEDDCMPLRQVAGFFDQWKIECDVANVSTVTNGKGADIKGLELAYSQNYDFLPGLLSGLGLSMNYTFQESESEAQRIGATDIFLKPLPQPYTPKHSVNTTVYWEKNGIQLRLAHRFNDEQLVNRGLVGGATWQESTSRLDFSSSYDITKNLSITFQALNLTDDTNRTYYTSSFTRNAFDPNSQEVVMDEGNALENDVTTSRTAAVWKTGRQFRLGIRGSF
ncbi:TonB-dependent receptor [Shewanella sp. 5_MG-2023]|uniref:TonB-dependent receptor n=1 Tax=unclassified Shewanella TaxID=196818 RepID=UPI000C83183E|nr:MULTISPECIES: TonB-dependent receptor [unclassified Shewanella]MDO6641884.1 TonB-dependent receptor [Shewanella sp. 5_MG-2023]PMH99852.1 TonB-dependent receptor [Shewanella sp. 10N.286.48.A6]